MNISREVRVNGLASARYTRDGSIVSVPMTDVEGKLAFSLIPEAYAADSQVIADLVLTRNSRTIRQPIGTGFMTMTEDFYVPSVTRNAKINLSGNVRAKSDVDIYADGVHLVTVKASQMGYFKTDVELQNTSKHTYHKIHFEVKNLEGNTYRSKDYEVEFDINAAYVKCIYMSPNGHFGEKVKIYSADGDYNSTYYYWPGVYDTLTFTAEFYGDASRVGNVKLLSSTSSGKTIRIPMTRVGNSNSFTCSHKYSNDFPDDVRVSYSCGIETYFDMDIVSQQVEQYKSQTEEISEAFEKYHELVSEMTPEEKRELNEFLDEVYEEADFDLSESLLENFGVNADSDGFVSVVSKDNNSAIKSKSWIDESKTADDLLSEGYEKQQTYDPGDELYFLTEDGQYTVANLADHTFYTCVIEGGTDKGSESVGVSFDFRTIVNTTLSTIDFTVGQLKDNKKIVNNLKNLINQHLNNKYSKLLNATVPWLVKGLSGYCAMTDIASLLDGADFIIDSFKKYKDLKDELKDAYNYAKENECITMTFLGIGVDGKLDKYYDAIVGYEASFLGFSLLTGASVLIGLSGATVGLIPAAVLFFGGMAMGALSSHLRQKAESMGVGAAGGLGNLWTFTNDCPPDTPVPDPPGEGTGLNKIADPSGYVYEAVPDNRLSGVTVTAFYSENADGSDAQVWEAEDYDQINPQVTGEFGLYEWYVPDGYWQVRCEKDGYLTACTDWLPVPPPQMDVNIAMTSLSAPEITYVNAYDDSVVLEFSQYMNPDSINKKTVQVTVNGKEITGKLNAENPEAAPDGSSYSKRFVFTPDSGSLSGNVGVTVKNAQNYARSAMDGVFTQTVTVEPKIESITCEENLTVNYGEPVTAVVTLSPAEAAAGTEVRVSIDNGSVLSAETDAVVVGADGTAKVKLSALLPGAATVTYTVDGTSLKAVTNVECTMIVKEQLPRVNASIESGSEITKGTKLTLTCDNPDATIYYTLDLSCPCQEDNPERILYTEPVPITDDSQLIAYAILDGYKDSKTRLFTYTVKEPVYGDVNGDGEVSAKDRIALTRHLAKWADYKNIDFINADVNADSGVNAKDRIALTRHLAKWKDYAVLPVTE